MKFKYSILITVILCVNSLYGQTQTNRIMSIREKLDSIALNECPSLNEKVDISVSGVTIKEFIRGIAISKNINISVDNNLNFIILGNFHQESIKNILLYLCEEYNLNLKIIGTIITITDYKNQVLDNKIKIEYDSINNAISLQIDNQPLDLVCKDLTIKSGKNFIVGSQSLNNYLVKAFIQKANILKSIEKLANINGLNLDSTKDGFYIFNKPSTNDQTENEKKGNIFKNSPNFKYNIGFDSIGNHLFSLSAFETPIFNIIKHLSNECKFSYLILTETPANINMTVNNVSFPRLLGLLLKNTSLTYRLESGVYIIGERKSEGLRISKVHKMKYRSAKDISDVIPVGLKSDVDVKVFPELNSLLLSGSEPNINEIVEFLNEIDQIVPVIMIDLIVIDVNKSYTISTGIKSTFGDTSRASKGQVLPYPDFNLNSQSLNQFLQLLNGSGVFNLGQINDNSVFLSLKALEERGDVNIRSNPRLSTLNGHKASLKIGQKQYYLVQTQNVYGTQIPQTVVTNQYVPVEANLLIEIDPIVSEDDQVTMQINVEFSNFVGNPPANAPPPTTTRQFQSVVRVKNREMIILGGLEEVQKTESGSGVPFLSRVPILKWFFSQKSKGKKDSKLIVIIKVTIIN